MMIVPLAANMPADAVAHRRFWLSGSGGGAAHLAHAPGEVRGTHMPLCLTNAVIAGLRDMQPEASRISPDIIGFGEPDERP
jgi:hypothetical protein